jgi:hypothetical protein
MRGGHVLGIAALGAALGAACGGNSTNTANDGGTDGTNGGGSSGSSSGGAASSSGSGASSSDAGRGDGGGSSGAMTRTNDCPNCQGTQVCCLAPMGSNVQGTCAASASACPSGAASIECGAAGDCNNGQWCCISVTSSGGPSSTSCQGSCPAGSPPACGGGPRDNTDCDPAGTGAGWACVPLPGTPQAVIGMCVPSEGGAPPADAGDAAAPESGAADADAGPAPQDAAMDSG